MSPTLVKAFRRCKSERSYSVVAVVITASEKERPARRPGKKRTPHVEAEVHSYRVSHFHPENGNHRHGDRDLMARYADAVNGWMRG